MHTSTVQALVSLVCPVHPPLRSQEEHTAAEHCIPHTSVLSNHPAPDTTALNVLILIVFSLSTQA